MAFQLSWRCSRWCDSDVTIDVIDLWQDSLSWWKNTSFSPFKSTYSLVLLSNAQLTICNLYFVLFTVDGFSHSRLSTNIIQCTPQNTEIIDLPAVGCVFKNCRPFSFFAIHSFHSVRRILFREGHIWKQIPNFKNNEKSYLWYLQFL